MIKGTAVGKKKFLENTFLYENTNINNLLAHSYKTLRIEILPVRTKPMDLLACAHFITYKKLCYTFDFPLGFNAGGSNNEISVSGAPVGRHRTTTTCGDEAKAPRSPRDDPSVRTSSPLEGDHGAPRSTETTTIGGKCEKKVVVTLVGMAASSVLRGHCCVSPRFSWLATSKRARPLVAGIPAQSAIPKCTGTVTPPVSAGGSRLRLLRHSACHIASEVKSNLTLACILTRAR